MFVATDEDDVEALMGYNEEEEADIALESFLGVLLYLFSDPSEIHPAVLGHGAIRNAMERASQ